MIQLAAPRTWLACHRPNPRARVRLFCLPYAGGGASTFRRWQEALPQTVEVCPVQIPGRETRFREPPFTRLADLAEALGDGLSDYLDLPFALFGHSMGALVAFELARQLRRECHQEPLHLFVSGCAAPHLPREDHQPIHDLPEPAFRREIARLNGTPAAVLENDELMQMMLPILRADFAVCETYTYAEGPPLTCPISAFGGLQDEAVDREELNAWRAQTTGPFRLRLVPGDHFFLHTAQPLLLPLLARELQGVRVWS